MQIQIKDQSDLKRKIILASGNLQYPCLIDIQAGELRTEKQNNRYWAGVVAGIQRYMKAQGETHTQESIHEFLKQEKFGKKVIQIGDHVQEVSARSRKMSKKMFSEFSEWAEAYAIDELNIPFEYFIYED